MGKIIGQNDRHYPKEGDGSDQVHVCVVLVQGGADDYTAYAGSGSPEWVAAFGNKIPFEEAQVHFCNGLEKSKYRR